MLKRKFEKTLRDFLLKSPDKILLVNGARQIGKSYLIRYVCKELFQNYIEIDLREDKDGDRIFSEIHSPQDFYFRLSTLGNLGDRSDTIVFLDEIQVYPHLLTMLKFLNKERRFRYIASGSQLGIALSQTTSVPLGSIEIKEMYPLDFEEFLWAVNFGPSAIAIVQSKLEQEESLDESVHNRLLKLFKYYLLVGGLPEAVVSFVSDNNLKTVREIQTAIHTLYRIDASQYDQVRKLKIRKIYDLIPSQLENRKKRIVYKDIEGKKGKTFTDYADEFEYLVRSGIALDVTAVSNPKYPLIETESKNLVKLYLNDVGLLTNLLYGMNPDAVLRDEGSINLGSVYETVVAQELKAHGFSLRYYDNKKVGEVDFLIDDQASLSTMPIEVKSGKDYKTHSALDKFLANPDYGIRRAIVLSNEREIVVQNNIHYFPVYYCLLLNKFQPEDIILRP